VKAGVEKGLLVLLLGLTGCDDPLIEPQRIENTRVLGARVEVTGDAARARPLPGENVALTWLVADPRPTPPLGWDFVACVGETTLRGVPRCRSAAFASARSAGAVEGPPLFGFDVPEQSAFEGSDRVVVRGAVCSDAPVELAEPIENTRCDGDLNLVVLDVRLQGEGTANRNPSLADQMLSFDGSPWPAPPAELLSRDDCAAEEQAPELPVISANGAGHRFRIELSPDDRELLATIEGQRAETLQLSHFATLGRLERPATLIEPETPDPLAVDVGWEAPGPGLAAGRIARFYFVLRDLRGGTDWVVRTACVIP
jgi:hypothetical protein